MGDCEIMLDKIEQALKLSTKIKRRLSIDRKMIERRDLKILELKGEIQELKQEHRRQQEQFCWHVDKMLLKINDAIDPSIKDNVFKRLESANPNPFDGNF